MPAAQPTDVCGLVPATWYHLKVLASSAAGTTLGNYYFATLTEEGGTFVVILEMYAQTNEKKSFFTLSIS